MTKPQIEARKLLLRMRLCAMIREEEARECAITAVNSVLKELINVKTDRYEFYIDVKRALEKKEI